MPAKCPLFCPRCGQQQLRPLSSGSVFACDGCRGIWAIADVWIEAGWQHPQPRPGAAPKPPTRPPDQADPQVN